MRIQPLSVHVANQIAAGEVIERPASVVKELLENALDAGARYIELEIGFGGLNLIKISDDGMGIVAEDLPLAVAPHATSKLAVLDDLYVIDSMGFRGEALASICSVARVLIQSCAKGETDAMSLVHDEEGMRLLPCARQVGTTIEVRDLFFNAPVRKKFLKPPKQEYQAIEAVIKRVAFSHPEVAFFICHDGKPGLQLPAADTLKKQRVRLTKLLGKAFVDEAIAVDMTRHRMRLHGFLSGPNYARSQQDKIWFYMNQRVVRDKLMLHALKQAYAEILPEGKYPGAVLFLELPSDEVDVNVHPSKYEVRFSDARAVHDLIRLTVKEVFSIHQKANAVMPLPELYEKDSLPVSAQPLPNQTNWHVLNTHFAVYRDTSQAYLVDVVQFMRFIKREELLSAVKPWGNRPLLVPVVITLTSDEQAHCEKYHALLERFGMHWEVVDENNLRVRAIPTLLPALDVKQCFKAFCALSDVTESALLTCFLSAETLSAYTLSALEKEALTDAFRRLDKAACAPFSRALDVSACQKVFHDA